MQLINIFGILSELSFLLIEHIKSNIGLLHLEVSGHFAATVLQRLSAHETRVYSSKDLQHSQGGTCTVFSGIKDSTFMDHSNI